jgi:1-acyl-sn-glycerol-3-phosphate acyltransferase
MSRFFEILVFYFRLMLSLVWLVIASLVGFPIALIRWKNGDNNHIFGKIYGGPARAMMGIRIQIEGAEYFKTRPCIFAANHQSGLDLAILASVFPRGCVVIGKKELRRIPVFGLMFEAFGNVLIDRKDRRNSLSGLSEAVSEMKERNLSAWIFPEGTRNASGEGLLPFKKGAFYMALQAGSPVVPVVCSRLERLVNFHHRHARSGTLIVRALPPVSVAGLSEKGVEALLEKTRNQMLVALADVSARAEAIDGVRPG